jgi:LAS superfamily LD-carboxypeptidase LdcB
LAWMQKNAQKYGFIRTVPTETWHWEYRPGSLCNAIVKWTCSNGGSTTTNGVKPPTSGSSANSNGVQPPTSGSSAGGSPAPSGTVTDSSCGAYTGAPTLKMAGNNGVIYEVTKIRAQDLTDPSAASAGPTEKDNTAAVATICGFTRLQAAAKAAGFTLTINSGFRTLVRQQYFWNCHITKKCNGGHLAAKPGTSNHGMGKALDLQLTPAALAWMQKNAQKYGFIRTVPTETWHWEYRPGSLCNAIVKWTCSNGGSTTTNGVAPPTATTGAATTACAKAFTGGKCMPQA